jgi:predicted RNA polymerase sigma factor
MGQVLAADAAVDAVHRSDWGRIVASLIGLVGDFDVAEEAAQEAFSAAVDQRRTAGVPEFPRAWIIQLDHCHLLHAARADLHRRLGSAAAKSYEKALKLARNDAERRFLERRLHEVQEKRR